MTALTLALMTSSLSRIPSSEQALSQAKPEEMAPRKEVVLVRVQLVQQDMELALELTEQALREEAKTTMAKPQELRRIKAQA